MTATVWAADHAGEIYRVRTIPNQRVAPPAATREMRMDVAALTFAPLLLKTGNMMNLKEWAQREKIEYRQLDPGSASEFRILERAYGFRHCIDCDTNYVIRELEGTLSRLPFENEPEDLRVAMDDNELEGLHLAQMDYPL